MQFDRYLQKQLVDRLFKKEIIIIYGPRQVGKTTLVKTLLETYPDSKYIGS
jgi:predicted AAA+ superfamily ATPase